MSAAVTIGGNAALADVVAIAEGAPVDVADDAYARMAASEAALKRMIAENRTIYGVTTGYGPLADRLLGPDLSSALQKKLLRHLATGVGPPLKLREVRAVLAVRAVTLAKGRSGVGREAFDMLLAFLNRGIAPVIPERGSVGASGDLTPLAHAALPMIGAGEAFFEERRLAGAEALAAAGLTPVDLEGKDGLALVNGTAMTTAIAALNGRRMARLLAAAVRLTVLYAEVFESRLEAWDPRLGAARAHPGQVWAHAALNAAARGSARLRPTIQPPPVTGLEADAIAATDRASQDPYSVRCAPQIFGAIKDQCDHHDAIVEREINAVTDNPVIMAEDGAILHGGNFFGQHAAFASDMLANAAVMLSLHAERAVARLTDPNRNGDLPAFLTGGRAGLDSGLMGAQVTASALVGEMRALAHPASIQSVPTNGDNQDVNPMGPAAARKTARVLELANEVMAIFALAAAQAAELSGRLDAFAPASRAMIAWVRETSPTLGEDRPLSAEIGRLAARLASDAIG